MPVYDRATGKTHSHEELPEHRASHLMYAATSMIIPTAEKQVVYGAFAKARYGELGLPPDTPLNCLELCTLARFRTKPGQEKGTPQEPGPLSLVPLALSQGPNVEVAVHGISASQTQQALESRKPKWEQFHFPGKISFRLGVSAVDALERSPDGGLDEISLRVPSKDWSREDMAALSDTMIRKLNVDGTKHPQGANVLIGLHSSGWMPYTDPNDPQAKVQMTEHVRMIDVFKERLDEHGLEVSSRGVYKVAGQGQEAELMFIKRKT